MRPDYARRLLPRQISELVVAARDGSGKTVVYETSELIEAPNWSPDGKWLVYNADGRIFRITVDGREGPQRINTAPIENLNNDHVLSPDGKSIYMSASDGHLYRCGIEGSHPVRISNTQDLAHSHKHYLHGISPDGRTLAYIGMENHNGRTVTRVCTVPASGGKDQVLTDGHYPVDGCEYSADGSWIYFNAESAARAPGHTQICRMRSDGSGVEQLTHDKRVNWFPHAAADGTVFCYLSFPEGTLGHPADKEVIIRTMAPDGSEVKDIDQFNGGQGTINVNSWSPDSKYFAYVRYPLRS